MQVNAGPVQPDGGASGSTDTMLSHGYDSKSMAIDNQLLRQQDEQAQVLAAAAQQDRSTEYAIQQLQGYQNLKPQQDHASVSHVDHQVNVHDPVVAHSLPHIPVDSYVQQTGAPKPMVGSEEYYRIKKYNHKEVERRRRETINKGIDDLGKVVPDCDKHKGQILAKAVDYIRLLQEKEESLMKQLTLEKLISEQSINELSTTNKSLKAELTQAWKDLDHYKRQAGQIE